MKLESERVGQSIVLTIEDDTHSITVLLGLDVAGRLGNTLLWQSCLANDGLELPEDFRPATPSP